MPDTQSTIGPLRTPPVVQGSVIALRTAGKSKRSIAKELGIDRKTVDNVLEVYQADQPNYSQTIHKLTASAFARVSQAIDSEKDTDTARWALERTVFTQPASEPAIHDHSMNIAVGFVPTSTPSLPSTTVSTGTEAPAKPAPSDMRLSLHENFSQFSDAQLEAELERRRAARSTVIDAEVVDAAR